MQLLIIGTMEGQIGAASQIALSRGTRVIQADDIENAMRLLRSGSGADLVMVDVNMDIGALVENLKAERISIPVIACGIGNDTQAAVRAIKAGAKEYVPLPPSTDLIAAILTAVAEENHTIVFKDPVMWDVIKMADKFAPSDASVLLTGASGTGKELMARYLHQKSKRANKRFVAINCAAIPENLLESELFGHEKGAFTGAVARRLGKFEEANGGTLLLDEISEMDPRLQAKLLRAIQEHEIDRIGSSKPVKVDVRIIATSNRNMEDEVARKTFREDLYFRLNVVSLRIPDLADRPLDIDALADNFVKKYSEANDIEARPLSAKARKKLLSHAWPGNVRELENTIHRAVLLANGPAIGDEAIILGRNSSAPDNAAKDGHEGADTSDLVGKTVSEVERNLIIDTLQHCLGNRTHAATILGISIRTLRNKLRQYSEQGISVPVPGEGDRPAL